MINAEPSIAVEVGIRQVEATFGRREKRQDPAWEQDFAVFLRDSHPKEQLLDLFARFRAGENSFDAMMRRVLMRALCKRVRSEEHTSELQSLRHLVCRLLLEK